MTDGDLSTPESLQKNIIRKELQRILGVKIKVHPKVKYRGIGPCWYIGDDWSTYAVINNQRAHRLVYELCIGPIVPGHIVCHKCDRPGCIRPDHLFQGTHSTNHWDSVNKGRSNVRRFSLRR